jgi:transposase
VVLYEPGQQRDLKQLDRQIDKEHQQALKALNRLSRQAFNCEADAHDAATQLAQSWRYHQLNDLTCQPVAHYAQPGRPAADAEPSTITWSLTATVTTDPDASVPPKPGGQVCDRHQRTGSASG